MNFFEYLSQPGILCSVTVPWFVVIYWYFKEGRHDPPPQRVIWALMICAVVTYFNARWEVTAESRSLYAMPTSLIFMIIWIWCRNTISPLTVYSLVFVELFTVDLAKALELVPLEHTLETFYWGIGGAGWRDALCIMPLIGAAYVPYLNWRISRLK